MPAPLTRKLYDSRNLRTFGAQLREIDLTTALAGRFDETLTDLAFTQAERALADRDRYTEEQRRQVTIAERDRIQSVKQLNRSLTFANPDTPEYETILGRLAEIEEGYQSFMSEQTRRSIEEGRLVAPEDLTKQYGDLGLKFDLPMTQGEADILAENKRAEQIRMAMIEYGPKGLLSTSAQFGTGVLAAMVDPLELATAFIPFVGQAPKVAALARMGEVGRRTLVGATNGFVGSVVTEPGYYLLSKSQQLDYTMTDALFNVGVGTFLGGGIGTVAGAFARSKAGNLPTEGDIEVAVEGFDARFDPELIKYYMPAPKSVGGERIDGEPQPRVQSNAERTSQQEAATLALTQHAMGEEIDIGVTITPTPKRPMRLMEYVASKGGVQLEAVEPTPAVAPTVAPVDSLYNEAVAFVTESGFASVSAVQRKLRTGYNRTVQIVKEMERAGVISAPDSTGSREVLKTVEPTPAVAPEPGKPKSLADLVKEASDELKAKQAKAEAEAEVKKKPEPKRVNPEGMVVYNPAGGVDLKKMAKLAKKKGFIKKESVPELLKALDADVGGKFIYSNKPQAQKELATWRAFWKEEDETGKIYAEYLTAIEAYPLGTSIRQIRTDIEAEMVKIDKMPKMGKVIARWGGLDEKAWSAEAKLNKKESGTLKGDSGKPFWRKTKGLTPDQLAERLVENGYTRQYDMGEAIAFVEDLLRAGDRVADLDEAARLTDLELQLEQLSRLDDEGLDDFLRVYIKDIGPEYEGDIQAFIDSQRRLRENEAINDELNKYGFADLTIDEISRIGTLMAQKDLTLDQAAKEVGIDLKGEKAKRMAQQRIDRTNKMLGENPEAYTEIEAAAEVNQGVEAIVARYKERFPDTKAIPDEDFSTFDIETLDSDIVEADDLINDYRASGDITPEEAAYLDELDEIDQYANDYDDGAQIAASCIMRD